MLTLNEVILARTQKPSQSWSPRQNQSHFDPYIKTKQFSARTQKRTRFWPPPKKQVKFDTDTETKSFSIPYTQTK